MLPFAILGSLLAATLVSADTDGKVEVSSWSSNECEKDSSSRFAVRTEVRDETGWSDDE